MKSTSLTTLILFFAVLLSACGLSPAGAGELENTSWLLTRLNGADVLPGSMPSLQFKDGQVSGNSTCNSFGGEYSARGGKLSFGMLATTLMACADNSLMQQESDYTQALARVTAYRVEAGQLSLIDADGVVVAEFVQE